MFETDLSSNGVPILRIDGKIIGTHSIAFKSEIESQIESSQNLIIDLQNVPLMDSSALGIVVATLQKLRKIDGKLILIGPQKAVANVLKVTRLDTVLEIYDDESSAISAFD